MNKKEKLINIFKQFLIKDSQIRRDALVFGKKQGIKFEDNLKYIFKREGISYIYQPNGSQNFPDFLLTDFTLPINIECKTSEKGNIVWNSGIAHKDMILLYASAHNKSNDITFFLGKQRMPLDDIRNEFKQWIKNKRDVLKNTFKNEFSKLSEMYTLYLREMLNDKIHNFLKNPKREEWENEVISFLQSLNVKDNK